MSQSNKLIEIYLPNQTQLLIFPPKLLKNRTFEEIAMEIMQISKGLNRAIKAILKLGKSNFFTNKVINKTWSTSMLESHLRILSHSIKAQH